jgi:Na+/melibiose symporter-like transporter
MNDSSLAHSPKGDVTAYGVETLSTRQQIFYTLPVMSTVFLFGPIALLQGIYATYFGLSLTTIAMVLLAGRLFDAVTDPLVGYLSDYCHIRTGSRKVFLGGGGFLMIVSAYFLYVPVEPSLLNASTQVSVVHFLVFYLLFYLSMTIFEIPHLAWGAELTATPAERNSLFSWRAGAASIGGWLFYAVPLLPIFESNAITPQTLQWTVLASAFLILPTLLICLVVVPRQRGQANTRNVARVKGTPLHLAMLIKNKPLLLFLVISLIVGMSNGMFWTMSFIYVNSYLGLGEHYALVTLTLFIVGTLSIKFWHSVASHVNKKTVWALGTGIFLVSVVSMVWLKPGEDSFQSLLIINILAGCGLMAGSVMAPSILSDIIDYSRCKFNADCSASFFSIYQLAGKASIALGSAVALLVAGWYGFNPSITATNSSEAIMGLRLATIWLPVLIGLVSIICILLLPNIEHRHDIIRRYLEKKTKRMNTVKNVSVSPESLSSVALLRN